MCDGGEEIILPRLEQVLVDGGARRYDPRDFTPDQFLARPGLFHLFAQRNLKAAPNQPRDIGFGRMVGNATHRNGLAALAIAGR